jgi:ZIP family zinc transporter
MNKTIISFLITFIAGISTILGLIPTYLSNKNKDNIINFSLSISLGVMTTVSIISLIPESLHYLTKTINFISIIKLLLFINIGISASIIINNIIDKKINNNNLYKLGLVSVIALILHNIPEGITTFITSSNNLKLGLKLSIAIMLHNIPEGIIVALPIYYSTNNRKKAYFYTIISGFSELLGGIFAYIFLKNYLNNLIMSLILGITSGIMLHISINELYPNIKQYKNKLISLLGISIGIIIILITSFI